MILHIFVFSPTHCNANEVARFSCINNMAASSTSVEPIQYYPPLKLVTFIEHDLMSEVSEKEQKKKPRQLIIKGL